MKNTKSAIDFVSGAHISCIWERYQRDDGAVHSGL
jgi:hypothetical protein